MVDGDHQEEYTSELLDDKDHQQYHMLIEMLNWIVCIGRMDVAFAMGIAFPLHGLSQERTSVSCSDNIWIFEEVQELKNCN